MTLDLVDDAVAAPGDRPARSAGPGPLAGYTIGVTADRRASEQIELLARKGATIVHGPTIQTHPLGDEAPLAAATRAIVDDPPDLVVCITALGVRSWMESAEALGLAEDLLDVLAGAEVWTRGPKATGAVATLGVDVHQSVPHRSTDLGDRLLERGVDGVRVAVQLDGAGNEPMLARLAEAGAEVVPVPVYRWSLPDDREPAHRLIRALVEGRLDAVTFTTRTAVQHLLAMAADLGVEHEARAAFDGPTVAVCVGPVCAERAIELGLVDVIEPQRARLGSMVLDYADRARHEVAEIVAGGLSVRLQGRLVSHGDGTEATLTDRERDVLRALMAADGRVLSKEALLRAVWGAGEADTHVVEVTVGRLRQRLGPAADAVETVYRRGYRLAP